MMSLSEMVLWLKSMLSSIVKSPSTCDSKLVFKNYKSVSEILTASSSPSSKPAKGLSSSAIALAAASSDIPHL